MARCSPATGNGSSRRQRREADEVRHGLIAGRASLLGAALVLCLAASGCSSGGAEVPVTLEVRDGWVREPGSECAGSIPFLYVHRDAVYGVEEAGGRRVSDGTLPAGRAVVALNEDLGVPRVPTFCRFRFDVEVPEPGRYRLVLEKGSPLEFEVEDARRPVTLVIS